VASFTLSLNHAMNKERVEMRKSENLMPWIFATNAHPVFRLWRIQFRTVSRIYLYIAVT